MPVPTEADWGEYQADLDQKYAHDLFAGHTNEEMQHQFYRNVIERTDELRWMLECRFGITCLGFGISLWQGSFADEDIYGKFREKVGRIEAVYISPSQERRRLPISVAINAEL